MVTTFYLKVEINGEEPFKSYAGFTLVQRYDDHHTFDLRVPLEYVESEGTETLERSKSFLGQSIKFEIGGSGADEGTGTKQSEFNGVVTGISLIRYGGAASDVLIQGYSPTIILDHGINTKVFTQTNLSALVSMLTSRYPFNGVEFKINASPDPQLAFVHQHKESTFDFLCRMADRYGQWFFYDGRDCIFGKLSGGEAIDLKFGSDLSDFELGVSLAPTKFKTMAVDQDGKVIQVDSLPVQHLDELGSFAFNQANSYFFEEQVYNTDQSVTSASEVNYIAKIRRAAIAADMVKLSGASVNAELKLGGNISVSADNIDGNGSTNYGTFTVIAIKHKMDGRGNYQNIFEAIPSAVDVPPPIDDDEDDTFDVAGTGNFDVDADDDDV